MKKYPQRLNFPEGPNQVLGTKLNKRVSKNKSLQGFNSTQQPACQKTDDKGEHRSQERRTQFQLDLGSKRWLRHGLPRRSESRGKSEREARWRIYFPKAQCGCWLHNMEKSIKKRRKKWPCQSKWRIQDTGGQQAAKKQEGISTFWRY